MLTRAALIELMTASEAHEEWIYKEMTASLFRELQAPLKALYDETMRATADLTVLTPECVRANPRIIKILRYCLSPVISQMRLGQLIGLATTDAFEEQDRQPHLEQAGNLVRWVSANLDRERFPWTAGPVAWNPGERAIAGHYAKLWTVSLVSNQNTATKYRNQRKDRQERSITLTLEAAGLTHQPKLNPASTGKRAGGIHVVADISPRHYVRERKILGGSEKKQKSDVTVRPSDREHLICIEAKAVGIRIDSTKRLKELNDKYTDWRKSSLPITTAGVVAGFFNELEVVATIKRRGIPVFFEHDLERLAEFLRDGTYYGTPWNPLSLFPDVPDPEVSAAMERIQKVPAEKEPAAENP